MKTSILSLLAVLGFASTTTPARAEDPAPIKITPEMQALVMQILQTVSSMKGDLQSLGIELPEELGSLSAKGAINAPVFLPESAVTGSTATAGGSATATSTTATASSSAKPTPVTSLSIGSLSTSHLSTSNASLDGKARLSADEWRQLFLRRQP